MFFLEVRTSGVSSWTRETSKSRLRVVDCANVSREGSSSIRVLPRVGKTEILILPAAVMVER